MSDSIIIVGASHAGIACAEQLRANGFSGKIQLIDRLSGVPLERPPLSKGFLQADGSDDKRFLLRQSDWFTSHEITLIDGREVTAIDPETKQLQLDDGQCRRYDKLVLATGAFPRQLDDARNLQNVFVLRHAKNAYELRTAIKGRQNAVVIGGGYIGLEVAASLSKAGMQVDVIEMAERLLARVASPDISAFFANLHENNDVGIHTGAIKQQILQKDGVFSGIQLNDDRIIEAELLLVGIGVLPDLGVAADAGLSTGDGIIVDKMMQSSVADIYAIGDVALLDGARPRIESVDNAQNTAARAAAAICGSSQPPKAAPWFWSEQFDARLQSAGIVPQEAAAVQYVLRPGKREGGLSVWSYDVHGKLAAIEAVRDPAAYMLGKKCLDLGLSPPSSDIGNADFDLKDFVASGAA
ncbi:FAD-dependent oxidoreductase [Candidatus Puniceispirillum sp.]|nr:FAD-dependent oxidoreductase [Candidatus Puniceispirillum sp.]